jgi:hypothetical protein
MLRVIRAPRHVGVFLIMLVVISASAAHGQTTAFTYQGQLSDAGALANASYDLRFTLFDTAMGGAKIGANQDVPAVQVTAGVFTVQLDFGVDAFPGANRFVEIGVKPAGVGSFTTLAPRQQISSSPYAIRTLSAATADALSSACVGCVKDTQIQAVAGSKVSGTIPAASLPAGSGNYLQNTTAQQPNSNFNIAGNGVVGGNLTVAGTLNANVSGNFIQNRTNPQAGANFNVGGNGTVGGVLSAGNVGVGTTAPASKLDIAATGDGAELLRFSTERPWVFRQILSGPSTGLQLLSTAGQKPFEITAVGGENVATFVADGANSRVGIGTTAPTTGRLHVVGAADIPAIYGESPNRGVWGHCTGASRGVYGDSVSGEGVHGESTSGTGVAGLTASANIASPGVGGASTGTGGVGVRGDGTTGVYGRSTSNGGVGVTGESNNGSNALGVFGTSASASGQGVHGESTSVTGYGVYAKNLSGMALGVEGNASQNRDKGGLVKAMIYVDAGGTVERCFNSRMQDGGASLPPSGATGCGFSVLHTTDSGSYIVNFNDQVSDRFCSITPHAAGDVNIVSSFDFIGLNAINVATHITDVDYLDSRADNPFMLIVY